LISDTLDALNKILTRNNISGGDFSAGAFRNLSVEAHGGSIREVTMCLWIMRGPQGLTG
jgi:hypothetical protein